MHRYLPHTEAEIREMLEFIGVDSLEDLFSDIPNEVRFNGEWKLPEGLSEYSVKERLESLSRKNRLHTSFLGCGIYDHIIPSTVGHMISKSGFYTAYTPYQAEISQGILQSIFEFQTMICHLTGLDASNASLYDGHTAASEAVTIALNSSRKKDTILISDTIHPYTKEILRTHFSALDVVIEEVPSVNGAFSFEALQSAFHEKVAGFLAMTPNIFGIMEDYEGVADFLHQNKALFLLSSNPMTLAHAKSQGEWGADVAFGDTQPFGLAPNFGGPACGYISAGSKQLRKIPGRIVGETLDQDGERAFTLTLQAREQHIKRERATSNICSNQALAALGTAVYLSTVGPEGLKKASALCYEKAHYLQEKILAECGLKPAFDQPFYYEFTLRIPGNVQELVRAMKDEGIDPGVPGSLLFADEKLKDTLIVAVTEKRSYAELDRYVKVMSSVLDGLQKKGGRA